MLPRRLSAGHDSGEQSLEHDPRQFGQGCLLSFVPKAPKKLPRPLLPELVEVVVPRVRESGRLPIDTAVVREIHSLEKSTVAEQKHVMGKCDRIDTLEIQRDPTALEWGRLLDRQQNPVHQLEISSHG